MLPKSFTAIGRIKKPFGTEPLLRAVIYDAFLPSIDQFDFIFFDHDGIYVPYQIKKITVQSSFCDIQLEEIVSLHKAEQMKSLEIYIPRELLTDNPTKDETDLQYGDLKGFELVTSEGQQGKIVEIRSFPQQEIASVQMGGLTHLIPLNSEFIQSVDYKNQKVIMTLPAGLLDL